MAVADALASIDGAVGTVIDGQNGTVWNPASNEFNSLLELEPGRSYWSPVARSRHPDLPAGCRRWQRDGPRSTPQCFSCRDHDRMERGSRPVRSCLGR